MAQIIDIRRVTVGPKSLTARVRIATGAPLMTSDDLEGTTRVYRLLPHIIEHICLGDSGETFKDVMGDTEIAHLLEHVTVELLAQSDIAGDVTCGRTWAVADERRTYDVEFPCPDDVLVVGALSSAVWIIQWAFTGGGDPEPDVKATVQGLVELVKSLPAAEPAPSPRREYVVYGADAAALARGIDPATLKASSVVPEVSQSEPAPQASEPAEPEVVPEYEDEAPAQPAKPQGPTVNAAAIPDPSQPSEAEVEDMLGAVYEAAAQQTDAEEDIDEDDDIPWDAE